jgi:hypothetical protein
MFPAFGLISGGSDGVRSRFHVLRSRICFRAVWRVLGPVSMFCTHELVFGGSEGVRSRFHALRSEDTLSAVPRASDLVCMFCAPKLVCMFCAPKLVCPHFHVLRSLTRFLCCGGRWVPFSCFLLSDSFSAVLKVSHLVFMFCAPVLLFGGTDGVGHHFLVLRSRPRFQR